MVGGAPLASSWPWAWLGLGLAGFLLRLPLLPRSFLPLHHDALRTALSAPYGASTLPNPTRDTGFQSRTSTDVDRWELRADRRSSPGRPPRVQHLVPVEP